MIKPTVDPPSHGQLLSGFQIPFQIDFEDLPTGPGMSQTKTTGRSPRAGKEGKRVERPVARAIRCSLGSGTVSEDELVAVALALLPATAALTTAEQALVSRRSVSPSRAMVAEVREIIATGGDPLGTALNALRTPEARRKRGQVFTPPALVESMLEVAAADAERYGGFEAIVDPGAGSGRFLLAAGARWPDARLVGVETDPVCAVVLRANAAVRGMGPATTVLVEDFLQARPVLPPGRTLFLGNPPYVRHHDLGEPAKTWYVRTMANLGVADASRLAGMHVYFFARAAQLARPGDLGVFVTAAEWLETGYGKALRKLLAGRLSGSLVQVIDPKAEPFPGVMTTAAVTVFHPHGSPRRMLVEHLADASRVGMPAGDTPARPVIDLNRSGAREDTGQPRRRRAETRVGDVFRVSRGQVTGCNRVWIAKELAFDLIPERYLVPCLTGAREIFDCFDAARPLQGAGHLKRVVDLPANLTEALTPAEYRRVSRFLEWAEAMGASGTYIARHRSPWWAVRLHTPPPLVCTYMARRPPAFVLNRAAAALLNIAHGLYPRFPLSDAALVEAAEALNRAAVAAAGRIYAGGLAKFEPGMVADLVIDWAPEPIADRGAAA